MCDDRDESSRLGMHVFACSRRGRYAEGKVNVERDERSVAYRFANLVLCLLS